VAKVRPGGPGGRRRGTSLPDVRRPVPQPRGTARHRARVQEPPPSRRLGPAPSAGSGDVAWIPARGIPRAESGLAASAPKGGAGAAPPPKMHRGAGTPRPGWTPVRSRPHARCARRPASAGVTAAICPQCTTRTLGTACQETAGTTSGVHERGAARPSAGRPYEPQNGPRGRFRVPTREAGTERLPRRPWPAGRAPARAPPETSGSRRRCRRRMPARSALGYAGPAGARVGRRRLRHGGASGAGGTMGRAEARA
jgi:hypothetical protein